MRPCSVALVQSGDPAGSVFTHPRAPFKALPGVCVKALLEMDVGARASSAARSQPPAPLLVVELRSRTAAAAPTRACSCSTAAALSSKGSGKGGRRQSLCNYLRNLSASALNGETRTQPRFLQAGQSSRPEKAFLKLHSSRRCLSWLLLWQHRPECLEAVTGQDCCLLCFLMKYTHKATCRGSSLPNQRHRTCPRATHSAAFQAELRF